MSRFVTGKHSSTLRGPILSICIFGLLFISFFFAVEHFSKETTARQLKSLENAIHQSIVYCYTLEGSYPESLEYIKEHYGLTYNDDLFFVDYRLQGANIMPDVTIIPRGAQ